MENEQMTLGSLFDGSGGFPLGGILAGITPVWSSEIEPYAVRVTTKRLPDVKHYGDISSLNGGELEPVDIITFGSPCQDMSLAGKRAGLDGERSGLFHEAIRVIKEMREATDGRYPKYIVWENVPGAFNSNRGEDFRSVLEEVCSIREAGLHVPRPDRWPRAGEIVGEGYSVAWRQLDAVGWGVPQRRKRIYLVADLDGGRAGKILFESEGLSGYSAEGFRAWQKAAGSAGAGPDGTGRTVCLNDQGGNRMDVTEDVTNTLRAESHHPPLVPVLFENHSQDARYTGPLDKSPSLTARYGTGGNNQPLVVKDSTYDVRFTSEGTRNARQNCYETDTARTLDTGGNAPDSNQGGVAVVSGPRYSACKSSFFSRAAKEKANTLVATDYKDPPIVNGGEPPHYIVRRLTPTECARLQGFPDWWCDDLEMEDPTPVEIAYWMSVFETHRKAVTHAKKPKTEKQVMKWLKDPSSDAAQYKLWGNGVALPCVYFVLAGIAWADGQNL